VTFAARSRAPISNGDRINAVLAAADYNFSVVRGGWRDEIVHRTNV
jgi:hypothetical protein